MWVKIFIILSGALFDAKYWEEVGIGSPTQDIYKSKVFYSPRRFILAKFLIIWKPERFLCREDIEEANFGGHFHELPSTFFNAVSFVGLFCLRRKNQYYFVIHLRYFQCNFAALNINKKAFPTETKDQRCRQYC